ncbi:MAG: plasmid pRiA4b ORF-3 family protein [Chitinophagaceae bacterium]
MIYHFYIELQETEPLVWRRVAVPRDYTFYQLHLAIQGAFGWENYHLFSFSKKGQLDKLSYGIPDPLLDRELMFIVKDAAKSMITEVFTKPRQSYIYVYDFGDGWHHKLVLERIETATIERAYCAAGAGACPPEDVGGIHGYREMVEVFKTAVHVEQASYIQWLGLAPGEKWDPEYFNEREAKKRMALLETAV